MTDIDPTKVKQDETLIVSDKESPYYGTKGRATVLHEEYISIAMEVGTADGQELIKAFDLEQLSRAE